MENNQVQGPRILGKIDLSQFDRGNKYSRCEECGHRSTQDIYIRDCGKQLCDSCDDYAHEQHDNNRHQADYWDGDSSECQ